MAERYTVLAQAHIKEGESVLEIGAGPHALTTIPLAYAVGARGGVVGAEIGRWGLFPELVGTSGLSDRIVPVQCDATRLPFRSGCFDRAVCIHGIRSLRDEETIVRVLEEMLRVGARVIVAESLPVARSNAQEAHLAMYNLREEIFEAVLGRKDDIHYPPLERLKGFVVEAGGTVGSEETIEIGLPHYLSFIPRDYVERIRDPARRDDLLFRWDAAKEGLDRQGAEHPPVAVITAERAARP